MLIEKRENIMNIRAEEIMIAFLQRDPDLGFGWASAFREVRLLAKCDNENEYLRASRKGSTVALNRAKRKTIWALHEKAIEHAGFEEWMKKGAQ